MNEKQSIFETIAQSWQYFAALIILVAIAFVITIAVEKVAVKKEGKQDERLLSVRKMAIIGVFSAVSFVLMLWNFHFRLHLHFISLTLVTCLHLWAALRQDLLPVL